MTQFKPGQLIQANRFSPGQLVKPIVLTEGIFSKYSNHYKTINRKIDSDEVGVFIEHVNVDYSIFPSYIQLVLVLFKERVELLAARNIKPL